MDCKEYITSSVERKKGQHLQREERDAIQYPKGQGYTNRAIAREIGCSPDTVANELTNELKRGTSPRKYNRGEAQLLGKAWENVLQGQQKAVAETPSDLLLQSLCSWGAKQFKKHKWSLDVCIGYARLHGLFSVDEIVCTRALYNEAWADDLDLPVA